MKSTNLQLSAEENQADQFSSIILSLNHRILWMTPLFTNQQWRRLSLLWKKQSNQWWEPDRKSIPPIDRDTTALSIVLSFKLGLRLLKTVLLLPGWSNLSLLRKLFRENHLLIRFSSLKLKLDRINSNFCSEKRNPIIKRHLKGK